MLCPAPLTILDQTDKFELKFCCLMSDSRRTLNPKSKDRNKFSPLGLSQRPAPCLFLLLKPTSRKYRINKERTTPRSLTS